MAITADTAWEVNSAAADVNGGGFDPTTDAVNGLDYSRQTSPQLTSTDIACTSASTTITSVTGGFTHAMEGNYIQFSDASANLVLGFYRLVTYTNTNTAVLDRSPASGGNVAGATSRLGGAVKTPGKIGAILSHGNIVFLLGNQSIDSATPNVATGTVSNTSTRTAYCGYATNRFFGNTDTKPILTIAAGVTGATIFTGSIFRCLLNNLSFSGGDVGTSRAVYECVSVRCHFNNFTNSASALSPVSVYCSVTACSVAPAFVAGTYIFCEAHDNLYGGFVTPVLAAFCIADTNTGSATASADFGFSFNGSGVFVNCVAYANGDDGFYMSGSGTGGAVFINCIAESNGRYGFTAPAVYDRLHVFINCAHYNNSSGNNFLNSVQIGTIAVTAGSVFTDAPNGDFSLNATANRGALLRSTGFPATFPSGLTANYSDIGAARHADPAAGGGLLTHPGMSGGMRS